jgi:hypothetical protein
MKCTESYKKSLKVRVLISTDPILHDGKLRKLYRSSYNLRKIEARRMR